MSSYAASGKRSLALLVLGATLMLSLQFAEAGATENELRLKHFVPTELIISEVSSAASSRAPVTKAIAKKMFSDVRDSIATMMADPDLKKLSKADCKRFHENYVIAFNAYAGAYDFCRDKTIIPDAEVRSYCIDQMKIIESKSRDRRSDCK